MRVASAHERWAFDEAHPPISQFPFRDGLVQAGLTKGELEVLVLVGVGLSNAEIAAIRSNSVKTIEGHVAHCRHKVGCASRVGLAALAGSAGMIPIAPWLAVKWPGTASRAELPRGDAHVIPDPALGDVPF